MAAAELAADWGKALEKDGKTLRRSHMRAGETSPPHMAGALLTEAGIVLGQTAVDGKSNEIPAMAALLELLDIEGALVTADAMHAQRHTAELIIGKAGGRGRTRPLGIRSSLGVKKGCRQGVKKGSLLTSRGGEGNAFASAC